MEKYMEVKKFEPYNFLAVGDDVLFNVNWEFVWKATGKTVQTTAVVRKVVKDGKICEKYHLIDVEAVTGENVSHHTVDRVKELLAEFMAGRPEGYMAGVSEDFKGSVFSGLIPGGEDIRSKEAFLAFNGEMEKYMEVKKFEPYNFL